MAGRPIELLLYCSYNAQHVAPFWNPIFRRIWTLFGRTFWTPNLFEIMDAYLTHFVMASIAYWQRNLRQFEQFLRVKGSNPPRGHFWLELVGTLNLCWMLKGEIWESLGIEPTTFSAEGGQLNHCATAPFGHQSCAQIEAVTASA